MRRRIKGLTYVEFGPDNGAILIDIGEGGLGFQSVMPVSMNQALLFKFKLPGGTAYLEGFGEVAWMNDSGKGGGLRFVDVDNIVSSQIREWTAVLSAPESNAVTNGNDGAAPADASTPTAAPAVPAAEAHEEAELPATISETSAAAETVKDPGAATAEIPSIVSETEIPAVESAPSPDPPAVRQAPAEQSAVPAASAIPEFTIEVTPAPEPIIPPAIPIAPAQYLAQNEALSSPAHTADHGASRSRSQKELEPITARQATSIRPVAAPGSNPKPGSKNLGAVKRAEQQPAPAKAAIAGAPAHRNVPAAREAFSRQPQEPAPTITGWEHPTDVHAVSLNLWMKLPQALRVSIGAAAGTAVVFILFLGVPYLKTQVQATANSRSGISNPANSPTFEVEVADINNRRWLLRSGGEAGSPFGDTTSKRETQSGASAAGKRVSRSDDSENAVETAVAEPQPKLAKPSDLALSRPRVAQIRSASSQLTAPSIFDGITPPIGSVTDRLATGGPEAPGIVPAESAPAVKKSTLQAAVLVQRVSPVYPPAALQAQVQGEVLVNATIGKDGIPRNLKAIKGDQRLINAALAAIGQWRYRPAVLAGEPIETQIEVTIDFHLK